MCTTVLAYTQIPQSSSVAKHSVLLLLYSMHMHVYEFASRNTTTQAHGDIDLGQAQIGALPAKVKCQGKNIKIIATCGSKDIALHRHEHCSED